MKGFCLLGSAGQESLVSVPDLGLIATSHKKEPTPDWTLFAETARKRHLWRSG